MFMCGWQVKLCDPLVTHGRHLSALEIGHYKALYEFAFLGRPTLVGKALCFTHELSFFLSYLSIDRARQPRSGWG